METYQNFSLEDLPNEEWRDVIGYEGLYQVSNLGRVKSIGTINNYRRLKILSPQINGRKYLQVCLFDEQSKRKVKLVHQLVAQSFIDNPNGYKCIDHINTIKTDNRVENIRWCDYKMNMNNPITKNKVDKIRSSICLQDWYIDKQRYSQSNSKKVLQYNLNGVFIKEWRTISEAARAHNTSVQAISRCCNGIVKTSMNYIWKFK